MKATTENGSNGDGTKNKPDLRREARDMALGRFRADSQVLRDLLEKFVEEGPAQDLMLGCMDSIERSARIVHDVEVREAAGAAMVLVKAEDEKAAVAVEATGQAWLERIRSRVRKGTDPKKVHANTFWRPACNHDKTMRGNAIHRHAGSCTTCREAFAAERIRDVPPGSQAFEKRRAATPVARGKSKIKATA